MWEDPWFVNAVNEKWKSMVENGLEEHLLNFIDAKAGELSTSQALDGKLWPIDRRVYDEYRIFSTYSATVDFLREFVRDRISFLTENFEKEAAGAVPTPPFEFEEDYYYRLHNANTMKCADLTGDGAALCGNTYIEGTQSQQWRIKCVDNGYYAIINRANGKAITDTAPFVNGGYQRNQQLSLSDPDSDDQRQQWQFVPLPTGGSYAIANRATGLAWNNSNGSSADGNPLISWDNDSNNPNKPNRHWRIIRDELKEDSGIGDVAADINDYIVTYSPSASVIRFLTDGAMPMSGTYCIARLNGIMVKTGQIVENLDISALPSGTYMLIWEIGGHRNSHKFVKL